MESRRSSLTESLPSQPGDENRAEKMREAGERLRKYTFYPRNEKVIEEERKLYWGKDLYPDRSEEMQRDYVRRTEEE